jgi:hypothetical protein
MKKKLSDVPDNRKLCPDSRRTTNPDVVHVVESSKFLSYILVLSSLLN